MSYYGKHNTAWVAWRMEERRRKVRRFFYNLLDDLGLVLWCMVGVIATAMGLFVLCHR